MAPESPGSQAAQAKHETYASFSLIRFRRLEGGALAFPGDNVDMRDREARFLSRERVLGSIVGVYFSLALAVLCFNFGLLPPADAPIMQSRAEELLFAAKQAALLAVLGSIAGFAGIVQVRFPSWLKRRNSGALTRLYFGVGLLASGALFLMAAAKDASWNGLALAGAVAWMVLYVLSLAVATANIGVGLLFGTRRSGQNSS